jgi:TetR/AcrR family transcriptional repressor of bet genes
MTRTKPVAAVIPQAAERQLRIRQRQKLIDACITALYQHGPSRTTIDKVVTIADMSPGIVNFYFETKAALLVAALDHLAVEFEERVITPIAGLRDQPVQGLRRLIELYLDPDIANPRKVSVWYAFWGESTSRQEYLDICGKRDQAFADLVREMMARLIAQAGATHLDADAVALGLIGALEMIWQEIAFQEEASVDRAASARRCMAYLRSIFPAQFSEAAKIPAAARLPPSPRQDPAGALRDDACRMLVAGELALSGVPAVWVPGAWPGGDVLAPHPGGVVHTLCVVAPLPGQTSVRIGRAGRAPFDFLALLLDPGRGTAPRRLFIIPADALPPGDGTLRLADITSDFAVFEGTGAMFRA